MVMTIVLERAKEISRYEDSGLPYAWKGTGIEIARFHTWEGFKDYIHRQRRRLKTAVAFSGSASVIHQANILLTKELKESGIL